MVALFKQVTALVFALIAALVVIISALSSGARISTVVIRAIIAFVLSGSVLFIAIFLLQKYEETYKKPLWLMWEEIKDSDSEGSKGNETPEESELESPDDSEQPKEQENHENNNNGFQPLAADDLKHVTVPDEAG